MGDKTEKKDLLSSVSSDCSSENNKMIDHKILKLLQVRQWPFGRHYCDNKWHIPATRQQILDSVGEALF